MKPNLFATYNGDSFDWYAPKHQLFDTLGISSRKKEGRERISDKLYELETYFVHLGPS